ncbi:MAG TPA: hypothetical protein VGN37_16870 [Actinocatenispora sp.]
MGDHKPAGTTQKHDPADLRHAARTLHQLARDFERDAVDKFTHGMSPYTLDVLTAVADERGRRIRGQSYDHTKAETKDVTSGATSDWLNPFGRFTQADTIQQHIDDAYQAARRDGLRTLGDITNLANALDAAADFYDANEHTNTQLTKTIMNRFLANSPAPERA